MPWTRPTLSELVTRIRADFKSRLNISGSIVRRTMVNVLAVVWASCMHMLHGALAWLADQLIDDISEAEFMLRRAAMYGIRPAVATYATGTVTATGTDTSPIAAETTLVRDDGARYRVTSSTAISGSSASVAIQAIDAGAAGDMEEGDTLTFEGTVAGVNSTVTVAAGGISGGFDQEEPEEVRDRFLLRLSEPPTGGSEQDYRGWALSVAGVTRAWVFPHENGLGTVVVRFVLDGEEDIFPDSAAVEAVQDKLDAERPVTAEATAEAPIELAVAHTIALDPDTPELRAAVDAELADLYRRTAEPGNGEGSGTVLLSEIRTAVGDVMTGVGDYTMTVPSADVVPDVGELATKGVITWA